SNEAKIRYLNISPELIKQKGVVSSDVAHDMAKNLHLVTNADLCVATTGYAEGMNPNKCYIGIYYKGHIYIDKVEFLKDKTRKENIDTTVSRSEERRVGKECRCRCSQTHHKKKKDS